MDRRDIVAVVLHFRDAGRTLACARSLQAEALRQLVLVDNSEDGGRSLATMRAPLEELAAQGLHTQTLSPGRNLGFARAVNIGVAQALAGDAPGVLLINSDARLEPGALNSLIRGLDDAAIAVPVARARPGSATVSLFGFYQRAFALVIRQRRPGSLRYPSGCCLLLRAAVARPPLFDEAFFFYGEDVMLGHSLQTRGIGVVECTDAVIVHEGSGSARNGSMFYEYHMNRGHWLLAGKLASNQLQHAGYIACRCLSLPLRALVRSLRFRSLTPWHGLLAATLDVMKGRCRSFTPPAS